MAIVEAISIPIGVTGQETVNQAANSYEDLGDAVAKTQLEAERLANTFGINDKRTQEAIKVAGKYKQEMEQLDVAIDGARGGVGRLTSATQGVVAGFEIAAGAAALFGTESEELEKLLIKVQGAMALSQGIKDFKEFLPAITSMATAIKTQLITAFTTLRGAIMATGIGALVIAIAVAIDQIRNYNDSVDESIDKELLLAKIREKEAVDAIDAETRAYESASEIRLLLAQKEGKSQEEITALEISLAKERRDALRSIYADDNKTQAERAKALEEYNKMSDKVTKLELNRDIAANARKKEQNEELQKSIELQKQVNAERSQTAKEMDEFIAKQNEVTGRGIENVTKVNKIILEQNDITLKAIEYRQLEALEKAQLFIRAYGEDLTNTFTQSLQAIDALSQAFAGDDEARQKKAFELSKKLSIVQTTIATIEATVQAYKEAQKNPLNQATFGGYAIAQAAIAASFGIAQIQQIRSQQFSGGTKPNVPSGSNATAVPTFNAPSTRIPGGGDEFTQVRRIYVTERDITNVQDKVRVTEGLSQF
jgi:hypothetical protein